MQCAAVGKPTATAPDRITVSHGANLSLLSPGAYLRSKLMKPHYDVRAEADGARVLSVTAQEASFLISRGFVFGKLDGLGRLEYFTSSKGKQALLKSMEGAGIAQRMNAEDSKTTVLDGKTYQHHMRRAMSWAR